MGDKIPAFGRRKLPWLARSAREDGTRKRGVEVVRSAPPAAPEFKCVRILQYLKRPTVVKFVEILFGALSP